MIIFGIEIRKAPPEENLRQRLLRLSDEMTLAWAASYEERLNLVPWVDWGSKEVCIMQRGNMERLLSEGENT